MMYLISLPEVAYSKSGDQLLERWFPPTGMFFKFNVLELPDGTTADELKSKLQISEAPVRLTKEEITHFKRKYKN